MIIPSAASIKNIDFLFTHTNIYIYKHMFLNIIYIIYMTFVRFILTMSLQKHIITQIIQQMKVIAFFFYIYNLVFTSIYSYQYRCK